MAVLSINFSNYKPGVTPDPTLPLIWGAMDSIDLLPYYDVGSGVERLTFRRSAGTQDTRVYLEDRGIILELTRMDTNERVESFGLAFDLNPDPHDNSIHVKVEFDVVEAKKAFPDYQPGRNPRAIFKLFRILLVPILAFGRILGFRPVRLPMPLQPRPFQGAVTAVVMARDNMLPSVEHREVAGLQARYDLDAGVSEESFKLTTPLAPAGSGASFDFIPFDFFRTDLLHPIPPTTARIPWANNSDNPLELEIRIDAAKNPNDPAVVSARLRQSDGVNAEAMPTDDTLGSLTYPSQEFGKSLSNPLDLRYAGVDIAIARPVTQYPSLNLGPLRVRVRSLTVVYS